MRIGKSISGSMKFLPAKEYLAKMYARGIPKIMVNSIDRDAQYTLVMIALRVPESSSAPGIPVAEPTIDDAIGSMRNITIPAPRTADAIMKGDLVLSQLKPRPPVLFRRAYPLC